MLCEFYHVNNISMTCDDCEERYTVKTTVWRAKAGCVEQKEQGVRVEVCSPA